MRLPIAQKFWFVFSFFYSGVVRLAVLLLPFRWLSPHLGAYLQNQQFNALATEEQEKLAWKIGRITETACKHTPWESKCLVQAIVANQLLKFYKIPCVLYMGVVKPKAGEDLKAHAWLCVGRWVITGRDGHQSFTIVSTFVTPKKLISA